MEFWLGQHRTVKTWPLNPRPHANFHLDHLKSPNSIKHVLDLDERFWNLPELLILKTKTYPWWENTEHLEFRSQCYILLLYNSKYTKKVTSQSKAACKFSPRSHKIAEFHKTCSRSRREILESSRIIDFENKNISVVTKHWKYRISVPMLYITLKLICGVAVIKQDNDINNIMIYTI